MAHEHSHQVHRQNIILHYYTTNSVFQASIFTARQGQGCANDQDSVFQKSRRYVYRIYLQVRLAFTTSCTFALNKSHWMISTCRSWPRPCLHANFKPASKLARHTHTHDVRIITFLTSCAGRRLFHAWPPLGMRSLYCHPGALITLASKACTWQ